jgi:hypothetical protein
VKLLRNKKQQGKEEGAAMLVTMLVLLMSTATAVFAVHATTYEIRSAGAGRQALQTQYVGESGEMAAVQWLDQYGPRALEAVMQSTVLPPVFMAPFFEPELAAGKQDYRLYLSDFTATTPSNWPIETDPTRGPSLGRSVLTPTFTIDYNDNYKYTAVLAGQRTDGYGALHFLGVTATSHGRTQVASDYRNTTYDTRLYHEGASDARAFLVAGPY